jgi:hypothetical protein
MGFDLFDSISLGNSAWKLKIKIKIDKDLIVVCFLAYFKIHIKQNSGEWSVVSRQ